MWLSLLRCLVSFSQLKQFWTYLSSWLRANHFVSIASRARHRQRHLHIQIDWKSTIVLCSILTMNCTMITNVFIAVRVWTCILYSLRLQFSKRCPKWAIVMDFTAPLFAACSWYLFSFYWRYALEVNISRNFSNGHIDTDWLFPCSNRLKCHHYKFGCRKFRFTFKPLQNSDI